MAFHLMDLIYAEILNRRHNITKVLFCLLVQLLLTHKLVNSIEKKTSTITLRVYKPSHIYDSKKVYSYAFLQSDKFSLEKVKTEAEKKGYEKPPHTTQQFYDLLNFELNRSSDLPIVITNNEGRRNAFHKSSVSPNGPNLDIKSVITKNAQIFNKRYQYKKLNRGYLPTNKWHKYVSGDKIRQNFDKSFVNGDISRKHYRSRRHAFLSSTLKPTITAAPKFISGLPTNFGYLRGELGRSLGKTTPYDRLTFQGVRKRFGPDYRSDSIFSQLYTNPYSLFNPEPFTLFSGYGHQVQQYNFEDFPSNFDFTLEDFGLEDPEDSYTEFVIAENEKFQPKPIEKDKEDKNNPFNTDEYFKHWMSADEYLTKPKETPDSPEKESKLEKQPPSVSQNKMLPEKGKEKVQDMTTSEKKEEKEQSTANRDNSEISVKVNYNAPLSNVKTSHYHHIPPLAIFFGFHPSLKDYAISPKEMANNEKKEDEKELSMKQSPATDTPPHTYQLFQGYNGEIHDQQKSPSPPEKSPQSHLPTLSKFQHNFYFADYNDGPKQPYTSIKIKTNTKEMSSDQKSPDLIKMVEKKPEMLPYDQQSYKFSDYNMNIEDIPSSQQPPTALKVSMKPGVSPSYQILPPTYYNSDHQPSFKINTMLENPFGYQHHTFLRTYSQEPQEHPYIIHSSTKPEYEQHASYGYNGFVKQPAYSFSNTEPDGSLNFNYPSSPYGYSNDYPQVTYLLDKIIQSEGLPMYQNSPPTGDDGKTVKKTEDLPKMTAKSKPSPSHQMSLPYPGYNNGIKKQPPPSSKMNLEPNSPPSYEQHFSRLNYNNKPRDNTNKPQQKPQVSEENKPKPSKRPLNTSKNQQQKTPPRNVGLSQIPYICYQCSPLYGNFHIHQSPTPISEKMETQESQSY